MHSFPPIWEIAVSVIEANQYTRPVYYAFYVIKRFYEEFGEDEGFLRERHGDMLGRIITLWVHVEDVQWDLCVRAAAVTLLAIMCYYVPVSISHLIGLNIFRSARELMDESPFDLRAALAVLVGVAMMKGAPEDVEALLELEFTEDLVDTIGTLAPDQRLVVMRGIHRVAVDWPGFVADLVQANAGEILGEIEPVSETEAEGQGVIMEMLEGQEEDQLW
jgi:hypothetical protein